jgi:hypothetical protein
LWVVVLGTVGLAVLGTAVLQDTSSARDGRYAATANRVEDPGMTAAALAMWCSVLCVIVAGFSVQSSAAWWWRTDRIGAERRQWSDEQACSWRTNHGRPVSLAAAGRPGRNAHKSADRSLFSNYFLITNSLLLYFSFLFNQSVSQSVWVLRP